MKICISSTLTASALLKYVGPHVYAWKRGEAYLYVGASLKVLGRLGNHNVIGVREPLQEQDTIDMYRCDDPDHMAVTEAALIARYRPKYNKAGLQPRRWRTAWRGLSSPITKRGKR